MNENRSLIPLGDKVPSLKMSSKVEEKMEEVSRNFLVEYGGGGGVS